MPTHAERLSTLEAKVDTLLQMQTDIHAMREEMAGYSDEMSRYRGFQGGVMFVFTCLVAFLTLTKDWIISHWK